MKKHRIVGLKYTHDSSVALIENGRLLFATELEKLNNGARYKKLESLSDIEFAFAKSGNEFLNEETDLVIDGWRLGQDKQSPLGFISEYKIEVSGYGNTETKSKYHGVGSVNTFNKDYYSYSHALGHIMGSYATSEFSKNKEDSYALVLDGGLKPSMYLVTPNEDEKVKFISTIGDFYGVIYGVMGLYFGPFKDKEIINLRNVHSEENKLFGGYEIAGKLMAFIGYSEPDLDLISEIRKIYDRVSIEHKHSYNGVLEHKMMQEILLIEGIEDYDDSCVLMCIHSVIEDLLMEGIDEFVPKGSNLIFSGGSALNIKWNNSIRKYCHLKNFWVTPFPNDSGSAIGAACCQMAFEHDVWSLEWSVYCGLEFQVNAPLIGDKMIPNYLGCFLAMNPLTPVLCLNGKAEAGPRALGNRSILMNPSGEGGKELLNKIKGREGYRPIAPICLLEDAPEFFVPGNEDKYMLFEHHVKKDKIDLIKSVMHIDGSARLQTISQDDNAVMFEILKGFKSVSGFGILCNTSANFNGTGFLYDLRSAKVYARNNGIKFIWTNNVLIEV